MTGTEITNAILAGDGDDQLTDIFQALRARQKQIHLRAAAANKAELDPGDEVILSGDITPKYLLGVTGKVTLHDLHPKAGFVRVDIDPGQYTGKFKNPTLGVPASCLTLVKKAKVSV